MRTIGELLSQSKSWKFTLTLAAAMVNKSMKLVTVKSALAATMVPASIVASKGKSPVISHSFTLKLPVT